MSGVVPSTIEELREKWMLALLFSEKAILAHPREYHELKALLDRIASETIDIGQYFKIARRLVHLLEKMSLAHPGSVFNYFYRNIDPLQEGDPRFLRIHCLDLNEQLKSMHALAADNRCIRLVKS